MRTGSKTLVSEDASINYLNIFIQLLLVFFPLYSFSQNWKHVICLSRFNE